jgi:hypothetical protein
MVRLVFDLAHRVMPASAMRRPEHYSQEDADTRFPTTQAFVYGGTIAVGALFAWGAYAAFVHLNEYLTALDGPPDFRIGPQSAIWWFFPGIGALALSWEITLLIWGRFSRRGEVDCFNYWSAQNVGFDSRRLLRWIAGVVALPIGVLTALALPMHTTLGADEIRDCGYAFAPCKIYPYSDARRMTEIEGFRERSGKLDRRAGIVIDFSDGRRWSSGDEGDFHDNVDPAFAKFLETKTQLPLDHAPTEADIPPLNSAL